MTNSAGMIRSLVERVERLDEEIRGLNEDKRDVYAEAKGIGLDPKILRRVVQRRRMDPADRDEVDALLDLYESALSEGK